jgi:AcrR family transcriptional regulator
MSKKSPTSLRAGRNLTDNRRRPVSNATRAVEAPSAARASGNGVTSARDDTRERLLRAALNVFARESYAAATTRMIAAESGANLQAITYYFGGKGDLYRAVVRHIADGMSAVVGSAAAAIEARLASDQVGAGEAREMIHLALSNIAHALLVEASDDWARIILREQMQPGAEFEILYSSGMGRMLALLVRLIAIAIDRDPADPETRARAVAVVGQVLVFRMARAAAFRTLGWTRLGADELAVVERAIRANTDAILVSARHKPAGSASTGRIKMA